MLRLQPGSLGILAPVCSSMGFLTASQSDRSFFLPLGTERFDWVVHGNILALRFLGVHLQHFFLPQCTVYLCVLYYRYIHIRTNIITNGQLPCPRSILLAWLLVALGHVFLLEQPQGSVFRHFPQWRYFCKYICVATR